MAVRFPSARASVVVAAASLLAASCATHRVDNSWPNDTNLTFRAVVRTAGTTSVDSVNRLKAYYKALQDVVGVENLELQYIGCADCVRLETNPPPNELAFIFYRQHRVDFYAFIAAFERVQASPNASPDFSLTFDAKAPPAGACSRPIPTCYPSPVCPQTSYCDADRSAVGCQRCPP